MGKTWLVRCAIGALLLPLVQSSACTVLFQYQLTSTEEEVRLPPPAQVPLFTDPPRHEGAPGLRHRFGAALAAGHFSRDVDRADDVELAIGVPGADDGAGKVVRILKTAAGNQVTDEVRPDDFVLLGPGRFGAALASGDFDGDGFDDLAIGAPEHLATGAVAVLHGGGIPRRQALVPAPDAAGRRRFGYALASGDLNGDGVDDLVVGEPGETTAGGHAARVLVIWGRRAELLALNFATSIPIPAGDEQENTTLFGASLAVGNFIPRADRSRPIWPDIAVGAPKFDRLDIGRRDVGRVYIFEANQFPMAVMLEPSNGWELYAKEFGYSLAAGNFNDDRDGDEEKVDLAIGAPSSSIPEHDGMDTTFGQPSGRAREEGAGLVFIAPHRGAGVSAPLRVLSQDRMGLSQKGDHFGWSLAAGDFNRDGPADLAIGSPNERMAPGLDLSGVKEAGAVYFRFGNSGDWDAAGNPGGIPQIPVACFDYIDAVRGAASSRKSDRFGSVLLRAFFNVDNAVDLIVGAPDTDVDSAGGEVTDAGAVWIGLNQETRPGPFDGEFTGSFRDDACGGDEDVAITMDIRNREDAVCGVLRTNRALCFEIEEDTSIRVQQIEVSVLAGKLGDANTMNLEYTLRDEDGRSVGTLSVDAHVADADSDMTVDLHFVGRGDAKGVERSAEDIVLERQ